MQDEKRKKILKFLSTFSSSIVKVYFSNFLVCVCDYHNIVFCHILYTVLGSCQCFIRLEFTVRLYSVGLFYMFLCLS